MRMRRGSLLAVAGITTSLALTCCTPGPTAEQATSTAAMSGSAPASSPGQTVEAAPTTSIIKDGHEVIAEDLEAPWSVVFREQTALISERDSGRILELGENGATREIGVIPGVVHGGEGGLLGLAMRGTDQLYAYSTGADGNRIQRFDLIGKPGSLALGGVTTLLDGIPAGTNHNGGRLGFGPDKMLYATTGDTGDRSLAQDRESLGGKILRMEPDGGIPASNPFDDSYVYSYGHRNPQGLAWDAVGTLYATEFGQSTWDELNVITAGANYGWPAVEGIADEEGFTDPVQQWEPAEASPSGMAITAGAIFIANLRGAALRVVPVAEDGTSNEHFVGQFGRLRQAVLAPDGDLWFLTNNTDGRGSPGPEDDQIISVGIRGS
ncbi:PQQ-dependent sugar dehydrogenase [Arthrobacter rhombi]|uniref:PQQ-dependent sugar dehydrogenase n=1 Tax=Arthrobacter rhombi TaxID=71253 RepID=UPI003F91516B